MSKLKISKEMLYSLYHEEKLSIRKVAKKLGGSKGQVEYLLELYDIPKRSYSASHKLTHVQNKIKSKSEEVKALEKRIGNCSIHTDFKPMKKKNMLIPVPLGAKSRDAIVTFVISDGHIGDANHLPKCFWSTVNNAIEVIRNIKGLYKIKKLNIVINGDIVSGVNIYKYQELRNLVQRGHWQVFLAEIIIKDIIEKLREIRKTDEIVFVRGTHETLGNNFMMYLKRMIDGNGLYLSHGGAYNIGSKLDKYHVLFMHGYGFSGNAPVSTRMINDIMKISNDYRDKNIKIERVCSAHSHWLSNNFIMNNLYWDTTGGFQKWEYTINQRPCGMIVYLHSGGECLSIPVRPDPDIEMEEKFDSGLDYKNLIYYGNYLLKHLKEVEGIET